jgi:demethylspheroidene O-methyltransferase
LLLERKHGAGDSVPGGIPWSFLHIKQRRDRLLADPRFHRWTARFWPTRWVARREARALFDICAGFVYAQVLSACLELGVFERVARGPVAVGALAAGCAVREPEMRMLIAAAVSLRLLEWRRCDVGLGMLGAALRGNPGLKAMVAHHRLFYADIADPVALLRGQTATRLSGFWPEAGQAGAAADYSALMAATQPMIAAEIFAAYDVSRHACVLDVGGGDGSFLIQLAARAPAARLMLFDLPAVAVQARARFAQSGLAGRAQIVSGNFHDDPLPQGADLITLVRVLHDHGDADVLNLLRAVRIALAPGGSLLLAEPMAGAKGAEPVGAAYFGFYLLAKGSGRPRTPAELESLLHDAGFSQVRRRRTGQPLLTGILLAKS